MRVSPCPAVKPVGLQMAAGVARYARNGDLPVYGIGGMTPWRDAAE